MTVIEPSGPRGIGVGEASVISMVQLRKKLGMLDNSQAEAFTETSDFHLLTGNRRLPRRTPALAASADSEVVHSRLASIKAQNEHALRDLPPHEELLGRIHRVHSARAS